MGLLNLKCTNCGGTLDVAENLEVFFCMHCGAKNVLDKRQIVNQFTTNNTTVQNIDRMEKHVYGIEGKDAEELIKDGNSLLAVGSE